MNMKLSENFESRTRALFGDERYERFASALDEEPVVSVRLNNRKPFAKLGGEPVPWAPEGCYLPEEFFAQNTADGSAVIFFTISSEMSSTWHNAHLAAEAYPDVYVVDTRNLSTGGGLLVVKAAEMAAAGVPAAEIAEACAATTACVDASFIIDSLEFLYKGGRCSALAAFGANVLSLKPCIVVKDGKMGVGKKYRGKFGAVLPKYVADRLGDASDVIKDHIFVTHAGCEPDVINACVDAVKAIAPEAQVHITRAGCTISSHCGRNTLGVLFIRTHALGE